MRGFHTFPKGIFPKLNVIAQVDIELAYYDSVIQCFNHFNHEDTCRFLANVPGYYIVVREFEFQLLNYVHFRA